MTGFETYQLCHSLKLHFNESRYDYFIYNGKTNITINFIKPTATKIGISIYDNERYHSWYDYYTPSCDEEPYINENQLACPIIKM